MLKELCLLNGASGREDAVREFIIAQIKDYCEYSVDSLGNIIAFKKGAVEPENRLMICAHMDEVAFIVNYITDDGYLKISPVGGVDPRVVVGRRVTVNGINGVIGSKAVHLLSDDEKKKAPDFEKLYVDIGAVDRKQAEKYVSLGDTVYFNSDFLEFGNGYVKSKALDDRIGCYLMIKLIKSKIKHSTYFCFNVQEEVGLRGAECSAYTVNPDVSLILEATTAADLNCVSGADRCCVLGEGPVISYMDRHTIYDKELYSSAMNCAAEIGIKAQTKTRIAGGNDAGAVQRSGNGCRVLAVSLPCRYIHSGASVVKKSDIEQTEKLLKAYLERIYD